MSYPLFTELTIEQQEIVSGGANPNPITPDLNQLLQTINSSIPFTTANSAINPLFPANQINTTPAIPFNLPSILTTSSNFILP